MMIGHMYAAGGAPLDIDIDGAIPFANYDLYVYYNSSGVTNTQKFSLLTSGDLADTGISITAFEAPGADGSYVLGTSLTNGNYVKFSGLNNLDLPSFVLHTRPGWRRSIRIYQRHSDRQRARAGLVGNCRTWRAVAVADRRAAHAKRICNSERRPVAAAMCIVGNGQHTPLAIGVLTSQGNLRPISRFARGW